MARAYNKVFKYIEIRDLNIRSQKVEEKWKNATYERGALATGF